MSGQVDISRNLRVAPDRPADAAPRDGRRDAGPLRQRTGQFSDVTALQSRGCQTWGLAEQGRFLQQLCRAAVGASSSGLPSELHYFLM